MRNFKLNPHAALMTTAALLLLAGGRPLLATEVDNRIESSAKASYNFKTYLKADSIKVSADRGVVTLTGTVSEDYHKSLAEETVAGLPGVKSVTNQLTITGDLPAEHSDTWVSTKVMAALAFHKHVNAMATTVHTQGGIVTLTGNADNQAQKDLTGEYAKDVEGVNSVVNNLTVVSPAKPAKESMGEKIDDTSITAELKTTLLFHKSTHTLGTKVITKDGVVSLHGEAKNEAERELVTRLAEDTKGVKGVHNHMTIQKS